ESCVTCCVALMVAMQVFPVMVTLSGPILTSFPQNTAIGSSLSAAVGSSLNTGRVSYPFWG
ncbi:KRFJ protein, partial [Todus mexicanus]|nr:KRFJ protein [Todus mexicanus]